MVKANELRLGNWLRFKHPTKGIWGTAQVEAKTIGNMIAFPNHEFIREYIEPIPLTPEILEKCGFKPSFLDKKRFGWAMTPGRGLPTFELCMPADSPPHYVDGAFCPEITSLHQLQNLYFALTGKELEVNL